MSKKTKHSNQSHSTDAVLGGNSPPISGAVLGGTVPPVKSAFPVRPPRTDLKEAISQLHYKIQHDSVRFKDFKDLKSGRDEFSRLSGQKLEDEIPLSIREALTTRLSVEEQQPNFVEKIYRWWLRGLEIEAAIRKVRVDEEVSHNAAIANYGLNRRH